MNLAQLLLLSAAMILVGVGLIVEALKTLAMRRHELERFEAVGMNVICVGFLGMAGMVLAVFLI